MESRAVNDVWVVQRFPRREAIGVRNVGECAALLVLVCRVIFQVHGDGRVVVPDAGSGLVRPGDGNTLVLFEGTSGGACDGRGGGCAGDGDRFM